jgi:hypothetical protein
LPPKPQPLNGSQSECSSRFLYSALLLFLYEPRGSFFGSQVGCEVDLVFRCCFGCRNECVAGGMEEPGLPQQRGACQAAPARCSTLECSAGGLHWSTLGCEHRAATSCTSLDSQIALAPRRGNTHVAIACGDLTHYGTCANYGTCVHLALHPFQPS